MKMYHSFEITSEEASYRMFSYRYVMAASKMRLSE